jgi:hypothetical protein
MANTKAFGIRPIDDGRFKTARASVTCEPSGPFATEGTFVGAIQALMAHAIGAVDAVIESRAKEG